MEPSKAAGAGDVKDVPPAASEDGDDGPSASDEKGERQPLLSGRSEQGDRQPLFSSRSDTSEGRAAHLLHYLQNLAQDHPHADIDEDNHSVKDYDPSKLATFRVFFHYTGTVLQNRVLWKETATTCLIYIAVVLWFSYWRWEGFKHFVGKESTIRAFLSMFSNLIGLLLSFYTSLNIGRWWAMRNGVQDLWTGASKLSVLLANGVTTDRDVLESVQRYARCSLYMLFRASQKVQNPYLAMRKRGLLKDDELSRLEQLGLRGMYPQASVPWAWMANMVSTLHKQGLTAGPPHYSLLLSTVEQGRSGISTIQMYIETPIPMAYLHVLGLMVKIHNVFIASLYGLICVMHLAGSHGVNEVAIVRTVFRAFFMPFLYNALLIINGDLTNPFDGDVGDLSFNQFDACIEAESLTLIEASENRPKWMEGRTFTGWKPDAPRTSRPFQMVQKSKTELP